MILDDIVVKTKERITREKADINHDAMVELAGKAANNLPPFSFEKALKEKDISFICEVKKASPSKGIIAHNFPYVQIARDYEAAGASCLSVLTEPDFFKGDNQYLSDIKQAVSIPILRKDFIVDSYQIYQSKVIGADCVLLICSILDKRTIRHYINLCDSLGLSAIVETHNEHEVQMAINAGARIIGVNNRNLKDFTVDLSNSIHLRKLIPNNIIFIAESGIKNRADIKNLSDANVNAVLIGETLMKSDNKVKALGRLRGSKIKICGLTRAEDIEMANALKPDYIGFVFAKSKRQVTTVQAQKLKSALSENIQAVGVFVDSPIEYIAQLCDKHIIDIIQLHGNEDEHYIRTLKKLTNQPIIKALRVRDPSDIELSKTFSSDFILLDSYSEDAYGGTGTSFDKNLIPDHYRQYFLAGGISSDHVEELVKSLSPYCIDVSSSVETDGFKDYNKVSEIIKKARNY